MGQTWRSGRSKPRSTASECACSGRAGKSSCDPCAIRVSQLASNPVKRTFACACVSMSMRVRMRVRVRVRVGMRMGMGMRVCVCMCACPG